MLPLVASEDLTLVVMAAGIGSRFGGTKQLAEVGPDGEALLDFTIRDARRAGFGPVVLVVRDAISDDVAAHLARFHDDADSFVLVSQDLDPAAPRRDRPWGTGHAVLVARDHVGGPFAVVNADDYYGAPALADLAGAFDAPGGRDPGVFHLVAYRLDRTLSDQGTVSRGVCSIAPDGQLRTVTEQSALARAADGRIVAEAAGGEGDDATRLAFPGDTPVSMNLWGLQPALFDHMAERFDRFVADRGLEPKAEFQLPVIITDLVAEGRAKVRVLRTDAEWLGVTYAGDLEGARARMAGLAPGPA